MSEEEKKTIEFLKTFIKTEIDYCKLEKNDAINILKLVENQDNRIKFFIENEIVLKEMNRNQMKTIEKQQKLINTFISNEAVREGKDFREIKEKYYECL